MRNVVKFALGWLLVTALVGVAFAEFKPLKLDTVHSRVGFTASTLLFSVEGRFNKYEVLVDGDPTKPAQAKVTVNIDAASIDTDNDKRDEHLSSPDFFDVKKYPKITFVSESITESASGLSVTGTLDMHGKKKKLTIPFKVARGKNGAGIDTVAYKGKINVNRNDFGIGAGSVAAKISLEDEVELELLILAQK
ncbi:MAG: YceI family protein [Myxococcales bacterium]